jgi:tRNA pseudouridine38-40 synthase
MARRVRMTVAYDGTSYAGWQRQDGEPTIQEELEKVIQRLTGTLSRVTGAGRTDAGVHALGQTAHFETEATIPARGFRLGMNSLLPREIAVLALDDAPEDFDARFSAKRKLYRYRIWNHDTRDPIHDRFQWSYFRPLDVAAMTSAARLLEGEHDFNAFRASDCERKTSVRLLESLTVTTMPISDAVGEGREIVVEARGPGFLKNMVRILVGTLVDVGRGKISISDVADILASKDRTRAGQTAPAQGLTLVRVDYE